MDCSSITDAVARATPNVAELLDRHAKWSAQMCRNVPSAEAQVCQDMPSGGAHGVGEHAKTCPKVPEPAGRCHDGESDGTNPPVYTPRERPLTDRQLMAARMVVSGYGSVQIAEELGVNRHTVAIWKRNPAFRVELGRLHAYVTASTFAGRGAGVAAPSAQRLPPPPPRRPTPVRMTRAQVEQEDRECEAMIEQMLRSSGQLKGR